MLGRASRDAAQGIRVGSLVVAVVNHWGRRSGLCSCRSGLWGRWGWIGGNWGRIDHGGHWSDGWDCWDGWDGWDSSRGRISRDRGSRIRRDRGCRVGRYWGSWGGRWVRWRFVGVIAVHMSAGRIRGSARGSSGGLGIIGHEGSLRG